MTTLRACRLNDTWDKVRGKSNSCIVKSDERRLPTARPIGTGESDLRHALHAAAPELQARQRRVTCSIFSTIGLNVVGAVAWKVQSRRLNERDMRTAREIACEIADRKAACTAEAG
eukprot:1290161-Pleurochrysis_carterae.AAC.1